MLTDLLRVIVGRDPAEPLLGRAGLVAILGALAAFGVTRFTAEQTSALLELALVLAPVLGAGATAALARPKVTPWPPAHTASSINGGDPDAA